MPQNQKPHSVAFHEDLHWLKKYPFKGLLSTKGYHKSGNFPRILFSRIVLKDIFATLKIGDYGMIYLHQSRTE